MTTFDDLLVKSTYEPRHQMHSKSTNSRNPQRKKRANRRSTLTTIGINLVILHHGWLSEEEIEKVDKAEKEVEPRRHPSVLLAGDEAAATVISS